MTIPAKQIGWSQEENLTWEIANALDATIKTASSFPSFIPVTTTTSTTVLPTFITTWRAEAGALGRQIQLPLISSGTYNFNVDWGDGNTDVITVWNQAETLHQYAVNGTYTVTITGTCLGWSFGLVPHSATKIRQILDWGSVRLGESAFRLCEELTLDTVIGVPDLIGLTSFSRFFLNCFKLVTINNIENWNVSSITNMSETFKNCTLFNQSLNGWDVSNVTTMNSMFEDCDNFNGNLSEWNISSLTNAATMFARADVFNHGGITSWNVSNVTNMAAMFQQALAFNQYIGAWDVSNVTIMNSMFEEAIAFNQDISYWDVSNVSNFDSFMGAKDETNYSTTNLNNIYNNWSLLTFTNTGLNISFGGIKYTAAGADGKAILENAPNNWTIVDGGII